jgi:hypothetical protein
MSGMVSFAMQYTLPGLAILGFGVSFFPAWDLRSFFVLFYRMCHLEASIFPTASRIREVYLGPAELIVQV